MKEQQVMLVGLLICLGLLGVLGYLPDAETAISNFLLSSFTGAKSNITNDGQWTNYTISYLPDLTINFSLNYLEPKELIIQGTDFEIPYYISELNINNLGIGRSTPPQFFLHGHYYVYYANGTVARYNESLSFYENCSVGPVYNYADKTVFSYKYNKYKIFTLLEPFESVMLKQSANITLCKLKIPWNRIKNATSVSLLAFTAQIDPYNYIKESVETNNGYTLRIGKAFSLNITYPTVYQNFTNYSNLTNKTSYLPDYRVLSLIRLYAVTDVNILNRSFITGTLEYTYPHLFLYNEGNTTAPVPDIRTEVEFNISYSSGYSRAVRTTITSDCTDQSTFNLYGRPVWSYITNRGRDSNTEIPYGYKNLTYLNRYEQVQYASPNEVCRVKFRVPYAENSTIRITRIITTVDPLNKVTESRENNNIDNYYVNMQVYPFILQPLN